MFLKLFKTLSIALLLISNAINAHSLNCGASNGIYTMKNCRDVYLCFEGKAFYWSCPTKYLFDKTSKKCSFYEVKGSRLPDCNDGFRL